MKSLPALIMEYIEYCEYRKRLDAKTLKAYRIDLKQYSVFTLSFTDPLSKECIDLYITSLHKSFKPKTVKRKIASLKAFFHFLEYRDVLTNNPFDKIDLRFREAKLLPKTIPFHSIEILLSFLYREKSRTQTDYQFQCCVRDIAVVELLFATGMRISELCSLGLEDIDFESKNILIYGKGAKERIIQIGNQSVYDALLQYRDLFTEEIASCGYLFVNRLGHRLSDQSVRFMLCRNAELAGIQQHITPHMFRHSFATLMLEQEVDIRYIQRMLGHSSINTTEIYTHVSDVKQKEILVKKHPRNLMVVDEG